MPGTPTSAGTATFAISLGGQSCSLALTVNAATTGGGTNTGTGLGIKNGMNILIVANMNFIINSEGFKPRY